MKYKNYDSNIYLYNKSKPLQFFQFSPTQIIVGGFMILILIGAILLTIPFASSAGHHTNFLDALFTATSATCVTGLVVFDTNTFWSPFGKIVIIGLIQIGGLGIMAMSTIFAILAGRTMGLRERIIIQESINEFSLAGIVRTIRNIVVATISIEIVGALILSTQFIPEYGIVSGVKKSLFHSISAFCNAGFDIFGTQDAQFVSLVPHQTNAVVLITISTLIILGGLGFVVWKDIASFKKFAKLMLHTKMVLISTAVLLVLGTLVFLVLEYSNSKTLGPMDFPTKILNAYFQSVTPRTAGYNAINIGQMKESSNFFTVLLMFIGAAPGSTGGGVKVTTFSIIIFAVFSVIKGNSEVNMLKRKVPVAIIMKALSIITISMLLVIASTMVLTINAEGSFLECIYEATSAFGTVGLSMGITPTLKATSKVALIVTMFLGRVGPLSAAIAFTILQRRKDDPFKYPEGRITVG